MFPQTLRILALLALLSSGGCDGAPPAPGGAAPGDGAPPSSVYVTPPEVTQVSPEGGKLVVHGRAAAGAQVRLASPDGQAQLVRADPEGGWKLELPRPRAPGIFGLSMIHEDRQVQGQGYLLLEPHGRAALLRAGAGAVRLDLQPASGVAAVDFDAAGGTVISGTAPPGSVVSVRVDGRPTDEGRADAAGRYAVTLPSPLSAAAHEVQVVGDGFSDAVRVTASPAQPLVEGPLRSQLIPGGLRADWLTPGGGVQSTILVH